jgi:hypothetical protein
MLTTFMSVYLIFIFFSVSIQITYGNNFNKRTPLLQGNDVVYTISKNGFGDSVSQIINQIESKSVELYVPMSISIVWQ